MAVATQIVSTVTTSVRDSAGTEITRYSMSDTLTLATGALSNSISVATATTDKVLDSGDLATYDYLWIRSSQDVTIQITDSAAGTTLEIPADKAVLYWFEATPITNVYLSNASGTTANIDYVVGA